MKKIFQLLQVGLFVTAILLLGACAGNPNHVQGTANYPQLASGTQQPSGPAAKHIALLLPLTGSLSPYAQAIKNGFFTAYYQQKQLGYAPLVTVYDTNGKNINEVYATAVAAGADFVVGPLEKTAAQNLALNPHLAIPVLALNTLPQASDHHANNFYEFGLSPDDEAQQAANKIWANQQHNTIVIVPNTELGHRLAAAFQTQLQGLSGKVVATQFYQNPRTVANDIQKVLQVSEAYADKRTIQRMVHQEVRFVPQRRHDFDSIFLVATPGIANQVLPLLKFYFAGNIPVYATSQINGGSDGELDGVLFCDMPWIIAPNQLQPSYLQSMQQHIQSVFPDHYAQFAKFYALGVDAFDLTLPLKQSGGLSRSGMPAATGTLYLTSQQHIYRQLTWAKIQNGTIAIVH